MNDGDFIVVEAINPPSVCCDRALLVCGLRTLGVALHPLLGYQITVEEVAGANVTRHQWLLSPTASDGQKTSDLVKQWNDPAWLAAHPASELAIVRQALLNIGVQAAEHRTATKNVIFRRGNLSVTIPANASPALRAFRLAQLAGTVPFNAVFQHPAPAPAQV